MKNPEIVVITGPTASGKTDYGIKFALANNGEVVSADSMQIYKLMDIGTAKPTHEEMRGIRHHMIDIVPPWEDYSVARYVEDASACIDDIFSRGKLPVIVGGTGLYIDSLLADREFSARENDKLRSELELEYENVGGEEMLRRLKSFDTERAEKLHANDKKRIIRAIEIYKITGKTITQHDMETKSQTHRYNARKIALNFSDRSKLYERIDHRVEMMIANGLEHEVRGLLEIGVSPNCTAMQAIGYKELLGAIFGEFSLETAIEEIKIESRRLAKRQLTWFRRDSTVEWINF